MVAIFVVMTIIVFILIDLMVQTVVRRKKATVQAGTQAHSDAMDLRMPLGYFFHPGHTWARIEETGEVEVGIDDFAQKLIGNIDNIELPEVGKVVREGDPLFSIRQGRRSATFVSPVNGKISSPNSSLYPSLMKNEPYGRGWIVKIEPDSLADDLSKLEIGTQAAQWMKKEIRNFLEFAWARMPAPAIVGQTVQDGGFPVEGILENMDDEAWNNFGNQFLQS